MFTIKFDSLAGTHKVTFENDWERLNTCRAAWYTKSETLVNLLNKKKVSKHTYYLVSYATPIAWIETYRSEYGELIAREIHVNKVSWDCSITTIQHLSRFLTNLNFFYEPMPYYQEVKSAIREAEKHGWKAARVCKQTFVHLETPYDIKEVFEHECPDFW